MAGKFFHTAHPHTLTDIRLTLLTQIRELWLRIHSEYFDATSRRGLWLREDWNVLDVSWFRSENVKILFHRQEGALSFKLRSRFGFARGPYRRSNNYRKQNVSFPIWKATNRGFPQRKRTRRTWISHHLSPNCVPPANAVSFLWNRHFLSHRPSWKFFV